MDVLERNGYWSPTDVVTEGDTVFIKSKEKDDPEYHTFTGTVESVVRRDPSSNALIILKLRLDDGGVVNISSGGTVTRFAPGDELVCTGDEYSPSQNPIQCGFIREAELR